MSASVSVGINNSLIREGVRKILSDAGFEIVQAVDQLAKLEIEDVSAEAHIVVVDRSLLGNDSAAGASDLLDRACGVRIVVLVDAFHYPEMWSLYSAGIYAYFLNHVSYQALVAMMQMVSIGQKVAPPELIDYLGGVPPVPERSEHLLSAADFDLKEREHKVLKGLGRGLSNRAISDELDMSEAAVKATVKLILRKLSVQNRTQAAVLARELAIIDDNSSDNHTFPNDNIASIFEKSMPEFEDIRNSGVEEASTF